MAHQRPWSGGDTWRCEVDRGGGTCGTFQADAPVRKWPFEGWVRDEGKDVRATIECFTDSPDANDTHHQSVPSNGETASQTKGSQMAHAAALWLPQRSKDGAGGCNVSSSAGPSGASAMPPATASSAPALEKRAAAGEWRPSAIPRRVPSRTRRVTMPTWLSWRTPWRGSTPWRLHSTSP